MKHMGIQCLSRRTPTPPMVAVVVVVYMAATILVAFASSCVAFNNIGIKSTIRPSLQNKNKDVVPHNNNHNMYTVEGSRNIQESPLRQSWLLSKSSYYSNGIKFTQLGATLIPQDSISSENNENVDASAQKPPSDEEVEASTASSMSSNNKIKESQTQKWRNRFFPLQKNKKQTKLDGDSDDGLTTRQRLSKMGLSVLLSYGFVSNVSTSITACISWFLFSKRTGLSPLAPNQWKPYVAVYAGLYLVLNIFRPARIAIAIALSRYFDKTIQLYETKFKVSKRAAIGITVFCYNVLGTLSMMAGGIILASLLSGVPIF